MTNRPDSRLLLPTSAVERVPDGAPLVALCDTASDDGWAIRAGTRGVCVGYIDDAILVAFAFDEPDVRGVHVLPMRPEDVAVDLSAPADGERVDAWSWALDRFNEAFPPRHAYLGHVKHIHVPDQPSGAYQPRRPALHAVCYSNSREFALAAPGHWPHRWPRRLRVHAVDPWPDLSDLTPDDAARAVVVAALVARGGAR